MIRTTNIDGYEVELDLDPKDAAKHQTTCTITRGKFSASLKDLIQTHTLRREKAEIHVPAWIVGDIENWAFSNGMMSLGEEVAS